MKETSNRQLTIRKIKSKLLTAYEYFLEQQDQENAENQDVDPDQYPPEDNVSESDNHESHTPMLDQQIDKYKNILNKK